MDTLAAYYARRAAEYERIYAKPERQADLAALRERIARMFSGRKVLELACGTGYWTEVIAGGAAEVAAFDVNQEVLDVARSKGFPERVSLKIGDAYAPPGDPDRFDALFAGFWWSHVPLQRIDAFLERAVRAVAPGALMAFLDNRYIEGSSTPVSRTDAEGNTYQRRRLEDGSEHEVLKNFPAEGELVRLASRHGRGAHVELLEHYWILSFWSRS
jgi:ubiquinone/menaquinone biosynthesis C-methylase UbiE